MKFNNRLGLLLLLSVTSFCQFAYSDENTTPSTHNAIELQSIIENLSLSEFLPKQANGVFSSFARGCRDSLQQSSHTSSLNFDKKIKELTLKIWNGQEISSKENILCVNAAYGLLYSLVDEANASTDSLVTLDNQCVSAIHQGEESGTQYCRAAKVGSKACTLSQGFGKGFGEGIFTFASSIFTANSDSLIKPNTSHRNEPNRNSCAVVAFVKELIDCNEHKNIIQSEIASNAHYPILPRAIAYFSGQFRNLAASEQQVKTTHSTSSNASLDSNSHAEKAIEE